MLKTLGRRISISQFCRMSTSQPKVAQPKWYKPEAKNEKPALKVYNTLTRSKQEFVPQSGDRTITWYSCGPTVYDSAHMGHARNYVSIDINRRIMQDYFGYNVVFVQNVTDIDDKIIVRARQNYLFEEFVAANGAKSSREVKDKAQDALLEFIQKNLKQGVSSVPEYQKWYSTLDVAKEKEQDPKFLMNSSSVQKAITGIDTACDEEFFELIKDVMIPALDAEKGHLVNDPEVFRKLPAYWESQFDKDMAALNVLSPTITTRVSEYVPEIISFVEKILENGYAYATSDGSVYFDTVRFDSDDRHIYAKCQPWNKGVVELINDAEGSLSNFGTANGKRSSNDFALWKASKSGEPEWESPWGKGRPGWHIECSVMASDIHGPTMDIHSGGIDLAFPHHDNELAQSEAYFDEKQWVNYFLHTGHLHIEGQKMSKSLKNFITIQEALQNYSPRQLRLVFASAQWNNQLDFKESLLSEVKSTESTLGNYFKNVRALKSDYEHQLGKGIVISKKLRPVEKRLYNDLDAATEKVHAAFCDNFSTPIALKALVELITKANTYIAHEQSNIRIEVLIAVSRFVTKILNIIGITSRPDGLGWLEDENGQGTELRASKEDIVLPYVKCLSYFRDQVRELAIDQKPHGELLTLTDRIRDQDLLNLNVAIDDRNGQASLVKFLTDDEKYDLIKVNNEKLQKQLEKEAKKAEQAKLRLAQEEEKREKAKTSPENMFKTSEYSAWDEDGLPIKDKDGIDITKSMTKKLKKQWELQKKLHETYFKA
ncbi:LAMI_0F02872g1_1 [Lachancea mirantina]|uniref:cysteine--tRNA ligase n=1 Tax=Lachancea mirantina TaxID=1230905 RepID=A0A1G4JWT9_9SACH|nr:LAMI_0F02872g1_1 [Lachancea mirantina]